MPPKVQTCCITSIPDIRRADFGLFRKLMSKVPWEKSRVYQCWSLSNHHLLRRINRQFLNVRSKQMRQKASMVEQGSSLWNKEKKEGLWQGQMAWEKYWGRLQKNMKEFLQGHRVLGQGWMASKLKKVCWDQILRRNSFLWK